MCINSTNGRFAIDIRGYDIAHDENWKNCKSFKVYGRVRSKAATGVL